MASLYREANHFKWGFDSEGRGFIWRLRSRGGLTTKIHAATDALGNPVRFILTAGQVSEYGQANALIEGFSADFILADEGYDFNEFLLQIKGSVHAIAHNVGAKYGVPHCVASSTVLPKVMGFSFDKASAKMALIAKECSLAKSEDSEITVSKTLIDHIIVMSEEFNVPPYFEALQAAGIPQIAAAALKGAHFMLFIKNRAK
ncbi:transposase [Endozoicomonas sp. 2B-B]